MLSSVFWDANIHLSETFYFNISESKTFKILPKSSKYVKLVLMIYTSKRECLNVKAYLIDKT